MQSVIGRKWNSYRCYDWGWRSVDCGWSNVHSNGFMKFRGCIRRVDISEEVYAKVIAMKTPDASLMSLVVSTMNGNILQFTTSGSWSTMNASPNLGNLEAVYSPHHLSFFYGSGT